jgi:UDP:flavonoid glycosyltransferase YjiC (YdhE family)
MRVLVTTTGYPGHVLPVVPFARACVVAGHEVCVVGPRAAGATVGGLGLPFCGYADPPREVAGRVIAAASRRPPDQGHAYMVAEGFGRVATRTVLADVLQMTGAWRPDVVVRESQEFAGYVAAEHHGVPHVRIALGLASTERETAALVAGPVQELRAELGLPGDPDGERLHGEPSLTLVPAALDDADPEGTHRFRVPRGRTEPLPEWWPEGDAPLVHVTFGSVAAGLGYFPTLFHEVADALADVPARVLVTMGAAADPGELGRLPGNVHAERWVPQERVTPHAAALVCHGGHGSVLGALAGGVPLVVMPLFAGDQRRNARRVAATGAGVCVDGDRRTMFEPPGDAIIAALPGAVRQMLHDPAHRDAARRLAAEIDALPAVDDAPDVLQAMALAPGSA